MCRIDEDQVMKKLIIAALMLIAAPFMAQAQGTYAVQPGDVLSITVLEDTNLNRQVLVRPDGGISMPIAGNIRAAGNQNPDDPLNPGPGLPGAPLPGAGDPTFIGQGPVLNESFTLGYRFTARRTTLSISASRDGAQWNGGVHCSGARVKR